MSQHRSDFKGNRGWSSSELIKQGDAYIELIEAYPCNNKEELCKREGEVMRATENTVNKQLAGRTQKQYNKDNKEAIVIRKKQYGATKIRCQCGANIARSNIPKHKKGKIHKTEMFILELADEV